MTSKGLFFQSKAFYGSMILFADFTDPISIKLGFLTLWSKLEMEQVSEKSL